MLIVRILLIAFILLPCNLFAEAKEVWVATKRIKQGKLIAKRDAEISMKEAADLLFEPAHSITNKRTLREISQGETLYKKDLHESMLVKRGSKLNVVFQKDFMDIQTTGMLFKDAQPGDITKVKLANGHKAMVQIVDENLGYIVQ